MFFRRVVRWPSTDISCMRRVAILLDLLNADASLTRCGNFAFSMLMHLITINKDKEGR
jgi:hypothetical protein